MKNHELIRPLQQATELKLKMAHPSNLIGLAASCRAPVKSKCWVPRGIASIRGAVHPKVADHHHSALPSLGTFKGCRHATPKQQDS